MRLPRAAMLASLAERLGGSVDAGLERRRVASVARLEDASAADLAPLLSRRHLRAALAGESLLLVDARLAGAVPSGRRWVHPFASWALARLLEAIEAERRRRPGRARVHARARVERGAQVLPGAVIGAGTVIRRNAVVHGGVVIGARCVIGEGAVIGRPGFGWAPAPDGSVLRIPQLGGVHLDDEVEVGALCTVDAGTLSPTRLGRAVKLDAHVHVGHNVEIGEGTLVAAQAGFAGSVRVGRGVLIGGQAGLADHVTIGDGARIGAAAGVIGDVAPGATVAGYPAVERGRWLRATARALAAVEKQAPGRPGETERS
ncbi:MAG: UDP-3-O-(3-hydroxymyristoyl)glucosamine N-acyltransferase [Polyangiaceae bacterium]